MSSLTELLGPDEKVILQTRQHWWVLFVDAALQVLGLLLVGAALIITTQSDWFDEHRVGGWVKNALWVLLIVLAIAFLWKALNWLVNKFTITTTKVVYQHGIISRDTVSVPLVKLDEVTLVQPLHGRILKFGRLDVENAAGGKAPLAGLEYLPQPQTIYRTITERAKHQRLLEGGGGEDLDGDGFVDKPRTKTAERRRDTVADSGPVYTGDASTGSGERERHPDAVEVDTHVDPVGPHQVTTETTTTTTSTDSGSDFSSSDSSGGGDSGGGGGDGGGGGE